MATYMMRGRMTNNGLLKRLFELMERKKTNLAISADVTRKGDLLDLARNLGSKMCILKTHIDIVEDFDHQMLDELKALSRELDFMILEDRKYSDIGNTVMLQYTSGIYRVSNWADIVTAHSTSGRGVVDGLRRGCAGISEDRGVLLISSMSSKDALIKPGTDYERKTYEIARDNSDIVIGFISQGIPRAPTPGGSSDGNDFIVMTPGVSLTSAGDGLGQRYARPDECVLDMGADVIIVGRAIINSSNPLEEAEKYRQIGWEAYMKRAGSSASAS